MELTTLEQAFAYFSIPQNCIEYMVRMRWPGGVTCPTCGSADVVWMPTRSLFQCKTRHPKRQFSVKVGTVFEKSPIFLGKWLTVSWMLVNCRNGISSHEVSRTIGVTQKSTWFMLHRLREAMNMQGVVLYGEIEADETYVGGRAKNKHLGKRGETGRSVGRKTPVLGIMERQGRVVAAVVPNAREKHVLPIIQKSVHPDSTIYTDDFPIYDKLAGMNYHHESISHSTDRYIRGNVHTNSIENFWSCLKRTLKGTYIAVEPQHLTAYVAEQAFRFNHRKKHEFTEGQRFDAVLQGVPGKRLTYKALIAR